MDTDDTLPPEQAIRIADAVEDIKQNVERLRDNQELSRDEYTATENYDIRDAVERRFVKLSEAMLDAARVICEQEHGFVPERRKSKITALEQEEILGSELAELLRDAVGFRDVLAHSYGPVIDEDAVYDAMQTKLGRYVEFVGAVEAYLAAATEE